MIPSKVLWSVTCLGFGLATALFSGCVDAQEPINIPTYADASKAVLSDQECLALNLYHESRSESDLANTMVAGVVLNRVADSAWKSSICDVVFQSKQFSWTSDGLSDKVHEVEVYKKLFVLSEWVLLNQNITMSLSEGADHYHTTAIKPNWDYSKLKKVAVVDNHIFYTKRG